MDPRKRTMPTDPIPRRQVNPAPDPSPRSATRRPFLGLGLARWGSTRFRPPGPLRAEGTRRGGIGGAECVGNGHRLKEVRQMATQDATTHDGMTTRAETRPRGIQRLATETKAAVKTTEFYAYIVVLAGILIAGLATATGSGHDDREQRVALRRDPQRRLHDQSRAREVRQPRAVRRGRPLGQAQRARGTGRPQLRPRFSKWHPRSRV